MADYMKTCTRCGDDLPATMEFFFARRCAKDGLCPHCKACGLRDIRAYRLSHRDAELARTRTYNEAHKAERTKKVSVWQKANPDKRRLQQRRWYMKYRQRIREDAKRSYRNHADEYVARASKRKAAIAGATGSHNAADIAAQYNRQDGACYWCGVIVGTTYHVDHLIPISRGGSNGPDNIVISCPTCNLRKWTKTPSEFVSTQTEGAYIELL